MTDFGLVSDFALACGRPVLGGGDDPWKCRDHLDLSDSSAFAE